MVADDDERVDEGVYAVDPGNGARYWYATADDVPEGFEVEEPETEPKKMKKS